VQTDKRELNNRLGISGRVRTDMNTFTTTGLRLIHLIPRISFNYVLVKKCSLNASSSNYYKLPVYSMLSFADNNNVLVNQNDK